MANSAILICARSAMSATTFIMKPYEDIEPVLEAFPPIADRLRQMSPLYDKFLKSQKGGN
ncbi:MAG: hypothetical protein R6U89_00530 [Dehalococcoidia bacterium]